MDFNSAVRSPSYSRAMTEDLSYFIVSFFCRKLQIEDSDKLFDRGNRKAYTINRGREVLPRWGCFMYGNKLSLIYVLLYVIFYTFALSTQTQDPLEQTPPAVIAEPATEAPQHPSLSDDSETPSQPNDKQQSTDQENPSDTVSHDEAYV